MSYIYDALKRADEERQQGAVTLGTVGRPLAFAPRLPRWVWGVIAGLTATVVLLVALTVSRGARSPSVSGEPSVGASAARPRAEEIAKAPPVVPVRPEGERPRSAPVAAPAASQPPASATTVPRLPAKMPTPATAPAAPRVGAAATREAAVAAEPRVPVTTAPRTGLATGPRTERPATEDREGALERAPLERAPAPPEVVTRVDAPTATEATPPAAEGAPRLTLQVLVYSQIPSQRMVFIDGRRYVEGDAIDADTVLERITADGVVVNRRGQRLVVPDRRRP